MSRRGRAYIYLASGILFLCLLGITPAAWAGPQGSYGEMSDHGRWAAGLNAPLKGAEYFGQAGVPLASPVPCTPPFEDMDSSAYYYEAVQYLYCHGAVSGYGDRNFKPEELVTRAQIMKIVVLALNLPFYEPGKPAFVDVP